MTDGPDYAAIQGGYGDDGTVDSIASRVISVLASRVNSLTSGADDRFLSRLCEAAQSADPALCRAVVADMMAAGVSRDAIGDVYIPVAARRLGAAWCENQVSFAEVTIGTSRLQSMLRGLGGAWAGDVADPHDVQPSVMMIVPVEEHHTLGAMVAAAQLRRVGVSVRLCIGHSRPLLLDLAETFNFDAVMISGASSENLDFLRDLIADIRWALPRPTPVVMGGAVMDLADEIRTITGADHATNDIYQALRLCRLTLPADGGEVFSPGGYRMVAASTTQGKVR